MSSASHEVSNNTNIDHTERHHHTYLVADVAAIAFEPDGSPQVNLNACVQVMMMVVVVVVALMRAGESTKTRLKTKRGL
jgi:hypothetical protein